VFKVSLKKITKNGRALLLAYDHGMEHGTIDFDDRSIDPEKVLAIADCGFFTGVVLQKGVAEKYYDSKKHHVPLIVKLNGKTNLIADPDPYSPQLCSVEEAVELGAAAVGYTVYVGSCHEAKMMDEFAKIERETDKHSLPLIGWMYPRGKAVVGKEYSKEILSYAARLALEVGAEMVKIPYSGDRETFSWVVKAAGKVKIVVQGGPKIEEGNFYQMVRDVLSAGAIGLAVGRNVWQTKEPIKVARKIGKIIYKS